MFPYKKPSQIQELPRDQHNHDKPRNYDTWLVQKYITTAEHSKNIFKPGTFLYICLAALLELHLSFAPMHVVDISTEGLGVRVPLKYRGYYDVTTQKFSAQHIDPERGWSRLRGELDEERATLSWMTRFFRKYFDHDDQDLQAAFGDIKEQFELRVQRMERAEAQLRDHMASRGISQSCRMAEMSIRESKRVMLLTALAFVFLPVSLASSIYGMV
ncbi:hypothetical protein J4E81_009723 [Alternaria sp. BMP 2799]|uniref:uncharacterized protein n=1 Tax=Alternaria viburni TaxID=566460 RepID=UPI0020C53E16|nr:uncharacterized protein J4E79_010381 [Alternaria viburni]KAI4647230.1 hypothetical protein J4E79_010381 [Alternaria viburni]KAI4681961.1 hypothetical protein J4E81_009723 [Alternaria sp. BMP 2799]